MKREHKQEINIYLSDFRMLCEVRTARIILYMCGLIARRNGDYLIAFKKKAASDSYPRPDDYPEDEMVGRSYVDEITGFGMDTMRMPSDQAKEISEDGRLMLESSNVKFLEETVDTKNILRDVISYHGFEWVKHDTECYIGHKRTYRQEYRWCIDTLAGKTIESDHHIVHFHE